MRSFPAHDAGITILGERSSASGPVESQFAASTFLNGAMRRSTSSFLSLSLAALRDSPGLSAVELDADADFALGGEVEERACGDDVEDDGFGESVFEVVVTLPSLRPVTGVVARGAISPLRKF